MAFYDAEDPHVYFDAAGVPRKIEYKPQAAVVDTLCFRHYNADEVILGRKMRDWLRFSVVYWHTFCGTGADPFGAGTLHRPWDDGTASLANARRKLRVAFAFFARLGVDFYTFHDRDIAPEADDFATTCANLDELVALAGQLQQQTGVRLLWNTCNLFAHPRYMNGAGTNPDVGVFAYAAAAVKKGLEVAKKLDAQNFIFWGGREGYQSLLNTNLKAELDHMAALLRMADEYKQKIGFTGQLCIEPKPKEPTKHQYDFDAMTVAGFLSNYGLKDKFKLNIEPNHTTLAGHDYVHDVAMASAYGLLGSIDANQGSPDLGWDTDQFPMDIKAATQLVKVVVEQGGIAPGGLNFDCKVRRESTDVADMFIAHIGAMDTLARALRNVERIHNDGILTAMLKERYLSFEATELGRKVQAGSCTLEDCEAYVKANGEAATTSGKQEHYEAIFNNYNI